MTNIDLPVVISASTDIGYVTYLMSQTEQYKHWSLSQAAVMFLPALALRQLRVYIDDTGNPMGFVAWAFVGDSQVHRFKAGDLSLSRDEWSCGHQMVLMHIVAPFGGARAIVRDFKQSIAKEHGTALRIKYDENRDAKVVPLREAGDGAALSFEDKFTYDELIERTSGSSLPFGFFVTPESDGRKAFSETGHRLCSALELKAGEIVLDARCRAGDLALTVSAQPEVFVDGMDRSAYRILRACEKGKENDHVRFKFRGHKGFASEPEQYDKIVYGDGLSREANLTGILDELSITAKPGALLVLTDLVAGHDDFTDRPNTDVWQQPAVTAEFLSASLAAAGFEVVSSEDWTHHQISSDHWLMTRLPIDYPNARHRKSLVRALTDRVAQAEQGRVKRVVVVAKRREARERPDVSKYVSSESKKTSLVMLSGGLDSVYTLWKLLKDTDDTVLAHHVNFVNFERRYVVEAERCRKIVQYLQKEVRDFRYSETTLDRRSQQFAGYDTMACGYEAGLVAGSYLLKENSPVDRWTVGTCSEEGGWSARWKYVERCVKGSAYPMQAPEFFTLPIVSKQEEIDAVPLELLRLTWACRRPILTNAGYTPCGVCQTCELFAKTSHKVG